MEAKKGGALTIGKLTNCLTLKEFTVYKLAQVRQVSLAVRLAVNGGAPRCHRSVAQ